MCPRSRVSKAHARRVHPDRSVWNDAQMVLQSVVRGAMLPRIIYFGTLCSYSHRHLIGIWSNRIQIMEPVLGRKIERRRHVQGSCFIHCMGSLQLTLLEFCHSTECSGSRKMGEWSAKFQWPELPLSAATDPCQLTRDLPDNFLCPFLPTPTSLPSGLFFSKKAHQHQPTLPAKALN